MSFGQAVLSAVERPKFARILERGEANVTHKGYYVDNIVIGEMGPSGTEARVCFCCGQATEFRRRSCPLGIRCVRNIRIGRRCNALDLDGDM